ncbi:MULTISPECIES: excisionase [Burkholderia]|uniref:Uncharacterized protein n=1 Tax=Burkholderia cepacia TaxID=292 RepID=A0A8I1ATL1_BURCE|nr:MULTISPECIES: excisionase [Burkholderia]MBA9901038.1 hypothetical protein [Burkholderia cepacia]MBA9943531.1 hypothetical protein [Burkholderia cepacia]MBA9973233.1 hypothetical protein [Burkholderia cepacia]MBA9992001.1 hypothetical protein [Burkholderia cepacia]MBB0004931.1 hypothetical protein [Burkholderia cepacia]
MTETQEHHEWLPLEDAARKMKLSPNPIRSKIRNGRLIRGVHFRVPKRGEIEIDIRAYVELLALEKAERKLPLIERIHRSEDRERVAMNQLASTRTPAAPARQSEETQKLVPLRVWAEMVFGEYAPGIATLRAWCKSGKIRPAPRKVGAGYFCSPTARYYDYEAERLDLIYGDSF